MRVSFGVLCPTLTSFFWNYRFWCNPQPFRRLSGFLTGKIEKTPRIVPRTVFILKWVLRPKCLLTLRLFFLSKNITLKFSVFFMKKFLEIGFSNFFFHFGCIVVYWKGTKISMSIKFNRSISKFKREKFKRRGDAFRFWHSFRWRKIKFNTSSHLSQSPKSGRGKLQTHYILTIVDLQEIRFEIAKPKSINCFHSKKFPIATFLFVVPIKFKFLSVLVHRVWCWKTWTTKKLDRSDVSIHSINIPQTYLLNWNHKSFNWLSLQFFWKVMKKRKFFIFCAM